MSPDPPPPPLEDKACEKYNKIKQLKWHNFWTKLFYSFLCKFCAGKKCSILYNRVLTYVPFLSVQQQQHWYPSNTVYPSVTIVVSNRTLVTMVTIISDHSHLYTYHYMVAMETRSPGNVTIFVVLVKFSPQSNDSFVFLGSIGIKLLTLIQIN